MICNLGWISLRRTPSPEQIQAEAHACTVRNLPYGALQRRNLTCIGWRATGACTPDRPREVAQDLPCHAIVPSGKSGYCEVQDVDTSERFRDHAGQDGIVMVVYPGLLNSAYAIIRTLLATSSAVNCRWSSGYREDEVRHPESVDEGTQRITSNLIQQGRNRLSSAAEVAVELKQMEKTSPDILETPPDPDGMPDRIIWTNLLTFRKNRLCSEYRIEPFVAPQYFSKAQKCYGERDLARSVCFHVHLFADLPFAGLETHVRRFAFEAAGNTWL
ncbi:hypothetical protein PsorP6_012498 [Peronosclerospora sorghi]|uniref:Uncharacterized protein n=1 Tax=Peronosclerospora sorghi TaxID=230839 RepID=A0ACC0WID9_9STRA|nr:hypothetical protein PsorP6_012498 [Peronosclerospora sorghi]